MVEFIRKCPICQCLIKYTRIYDLKNAELKQSLCRKCINAKNALKRKKIKIKHIRTKFKQQVDSNYFQQIDSNEKAYWLGYICADGHINKNTYAFSLSSKDKEIIEKFKVNIQSSHTINFRTYYDKRYEKTYNMYSLAIPRKDMVNDLAILGITNEKTNKLEMPNIDEQYYSYFFAGLFDGDGCITQQRRGNKIHYGIDLISTKEVLEFLQKYLIEKFNFSKTQIRKIKSKNENLYHIGFSKNAEDFLQWIYNDRSFSYMQRKYKIYEKIIQENNL